MLRVCVLFIYGSFVLIFPSKSFSAAAEAAEEDKTPAAAAAAGGGKRYEMVLRLTEHHLYKGIIIPEDPKNDDVEIPGMGVMVELREKIENVDANQRRYKYDNPEDEDPGYIWAAKSWYTGSGRINVLTSESPAKLHVEYITRKDHFKRWRGERDGDAEGHKRRKEYLTRATKGTDTGLICAGNDQILYTPADPPEAEIYMYRHKDWLTTSYLEWKRDIDLAKSPVVSIQDYITCLGDLLGDGPKYSCTGVGHPNCTVFAIKIAQRLGFLGGFDIEVDYHDNRRQAAARGWRGFRMGFWDPREWNTGLNVIATAGLVTTAFAAGAAAAPVALVAGGVSMSSLAMSSLGFGGYGGYSRVSKAIAPGDVMNNILYWSQIEPRPPGVLAAEDPEEDYLSPHVIRYKVGHGEVQDIPFPQEEGARVDEGLFERQEERKRIEYVL